MKRESKNNDYLFDAIIITIITLVVQNPQLVCTDFNGVIPMHGSWQAAGPCWRSQLLHKNRLLQTHMASMKDGMLIKHTLQTEEDKYQTWHREKWIPTCMAGTWTSQPRPLPWWHRGAGFCTDAHLKWAELPSGDTQLCSWEGLRPHVWEIQPRLKQPKRNSHDQQYHVWKGRIKLGPARAWLLWRKEIKSTIIRPNRTSLEYQ